MVFKLNLASLLENDKYETVFIKEIVTIQHIHIFSGWLSKGIAFVVKPICKKGKKTESSKYRPISVHPIISKVIERV